MFKFFYSYRESYTYPTIGGIVLYQYDIHERVPICLWRIKELNRETKEEVVERFKESCKMLSPHKRSQAAFYQFNTTRWQVSHFGWHIVIDKTELKIKAWSNRMPILEYDISVDEFNELQQLYFGELYSYFTQSIQLKEKESKYKLFAWLKKLGC